MREAPIEKKVTAYAESLGWWARKFSSPARRSVPDHIYARAGDVFFIEFKATGKPATKAQLHEHKKIRAQGFDVYVIDNIEDGRAVFDNRRSP